MNASPATPPRIALVLSGGGSRGAYEAGVLRYLRDELPRRIGRQPRIDIVSGTSVGAINGAFYTATADDPASQSKKLCDHWRSLRVADLFDLSLRDMMRASRLLLGGEPPPPTPGELRRGGLLNTAGLEKMVVRSIPWKRISTNIAAGHVEALSISTTHVASGRTVVFVEQRGGGLPAWTRDPAVRVRAAGIGPFHVLASAAIPVLFPAVAIDGTWYSDGGVRQNTPLSPALRLGADRILCISLKHVPTPEEEAGSEARNVDAYPSPWFLFGKTLDALLLDHTDYDIDRLRRTNALMDGIREALGPSLSQQLEEAMVRVRGHKVRRVEPLLIRPSSDIGVMAADYARSPKLRDMPGLHGRLIRYLAANTGSDADLLSYLLFDGDYASELMDMGHRDARAREEQLAAFFDTSDSSRYADDEVPSGWAL